MDDSDRWEFIRASYGGASPSIPTFIRSETVLYDSLTSSRDLGTQSDLRVVATGILGTEAGTNTLYYRVRIPVPSKLGIWAPTLTRQQKRWICLGILDANRDQVEIGPDGYAIPPRPPYSDTSEYRALMPEGEYYFTVTTNQWPKERLVVLMAIRRPLELSSQLPLTIINPPTGISLTPIGSSSILVGQSSFSLDPPPSGLVTPTALGGSSSLSGGVGTDSSLVSYDLSGPPPGVGVGDSIPEWFLDLMDEEINSNGELTFDLGSTVWEVTVNATAETMIGTLTNRTDPGDVGGVTSPSPGTFGTYGAIGVTGPIFFAPARITFTEGVTPYGVYVREHAVILGTYAQLMDWRKGLGPQPPCLGPFNGGTGLGVGGSEAAYSASASYPDGLPVLTVVSMVRTG